jgi:hypothetical protein
MVHRDHPDDPGAVLDLLVDASLTHFAGRSHGGVTVGYACAFLA